MGDSCNVISSMAGISQHCKDCKTKMVHFGVVFGFSFVGSFCADRV